MKNRRFKIRLFITLIFLVLAVWIIWSNVTVGITHYTIESSRLPFSFDHYKIVVVSDLHNAEFGEKNSVLIKQIEKETPDMIAVTGDLVDSSKTDLELAVEFVEELVSIAPCYYVTGNHEAWIGEQYLELEEKLLDASVHVIRDQGVQLTRNQETIQVVGLDDPDFSDRDATIQQSMLETKLEKMNLTEDYRILLSHRPEAFQAYVNQEMDLVLSGHAHGGQFRIPFIGGVVAPNQGVFPKYDGGIYSENHTTMIVSRGIGNSIIPIRINNRPEIVSVELTCRN